jgi:hypothetical protein
VSDQETLNHGYDLCVAAGRDPDEEVAQFVLNDYAAALLEAGIPEDIVEALRRASVPFLRDSLLGASRWTEIFVDAHEWVSSGPGRGDR